MSNTSIKTLHINISIVLNNDNWGWSDPKVHESLDFQIPVALFTGKEFSKFIEDKVSEMETKLPQAIADFEKAEAEKKEKEEAEKLVEASA
jgi:hypothetical protein